LNDGTIITKSVYRDGTANGSWGDFPDFIIDGTNSIGIYEFINTHTTTFIQDDTNEDFVKIVNYLSDKYDVV
jgi:hypothetical protein